MSTSSVALRRRAVDRTLSRTLHHPPIPCASHLLSLRPCPPRFRPASSHTAPVCLSSRAFSATASSSARPSTDYSFLLPGPSRDGRVITPTYDRAALRAGIVHFGVGGFHRAHLAFYMDALQHLQGQDEAERRRWGICGVGVRDADRRISDALKAQRGFYSLTQRGTRADDCEVRIIGSLIDYLFAPDEPSRVLQQLCSPDTRIVSLTITEAGYDLPSNPEVQHDVERFASFPRSADGHSERSEWPRSVFGWILLGIDVRRRRGMAPFAVMTCDNLPHNGVVVKDCLVQCARDPELRAYVERNVATPSSMVDRITPVMQPTDAQYVKATYGITDRWPIMTERYIQWVVEDTPTSFPSGRPPLERLSSDPRYHLLLVPDVAPYENMKLRLLNATHSAICYLGYLAGHRHIHDIMGDASFVSYAQRFMDREVTPGLPPPPGIDLTAYKASLVERFANPNIRDTALRVCMDGASKWPKFLIPSLRHQLSGRSTEAIHCSALCLAAWFRFLDGVDEEGKPIPLVDPLAVQLGLPEVAKRSRGDARALFKAAKPVFADLSDDDLLIAHVQRALDLLYRVGARAALQQWLAAKHQ